MLLGTTAMLPRSWAPGRRRFCYPATFLTLYGAGLPWFLAHELPSGVFYFAAFVWMARRRGWAIRAADQRT
jgi:hypothetical protein